MLLWGYSSKSCTHYKMIIIKCGLRFQCTKSCIHFSMIINKCGLRFQCMKAFKVHKNILNITFICSFHCGGTMSFYVRNVFYARNARLGQVSLYVLVGIKDILCTGWDKCHLNVLVRINDILCTGRETCTPVTCIRDKDIVPLWKLYLCK